MCTYWLDSAYSGVCLYRMIIQPHYACRAIMMVFNCDLNISFPVLFLYAAACCVLSVGLCLLMWSISLSIKLKLVSARSMISMLFASMMWSGCSILCVVMAVFCLGSLCSLIRCWMIILHLPM